MMTERSTTAQARSSSYFFLSYAHSAPLEISPGMDPDDWVRDFFRDLTSAVENHPARQPALATGFFDQDIPAGSNLKKSLTQALGIAEVFVPLYSPDYLSRSWPGRELACFQSRKKAAGVTDPQQRLIPVLWTPVPGTPEPPGFGEVLALGDAQPYYTKNGLQALLRFPPYRASYRAVVRHLADRIVTVAGESLLEPSPVPDIDMMQSEFPSQTPLAVFTIEVAAPTAHTVAGDHNPGEYATSSTQWTPFPGQVFPLAEYAKQVAERLDFKVAVSGLKETGGQEIRGPGIILIDPRFVAGSSGRRLLESEVGRLPRWVLPMLVTAARMDEPTKERARDVRAILEAAASLPTESSRQAVQGVSSLQQFGSVVPRLVAEAERQFLRHGGSAASLGEPGRRPRLGGNVQSEKPSIKPHPPGEKPDV